MSSINFSSGGGVANTAAWRQGPPQGRREDPMNAVAEKLKLSNDDLRTRLDSGRSLADVAKVQGVSQDDLVATIQAGLPAGATESAQEIATNRGRPQGAPQGPPPGPPPGGPKGELGGFNDEGKLAQVSSLLDTDVENVRKVGSASELVKMFQENNVDLGQLRSVLNNGDLLDVNA